MDLAYCRVSTTAQDLTRQIDAMRAVGIAEEHIYVDKRTGATMDRDGLTALLGFARPGDRINLLTLDRLGRNMRETLNLVHDLTQRGIFLRTLGDKLAVDTSDPGPGTDMAIALLAMFAQPFQVGVPSPYGRRNDRGYVLEHQQRLLKPTSRWYHIGVIQADLLHRIPPPWLLQASYDTNEPTDWPRRIRR